MTAELTHVQRVVVGFGYLLGLVALYGAVRSVARQAPWLPLAPQYTVTATALALLCTWGLGTLAETTELAP